MSVLLYLCSRVPARDDSALQRCRVAGCCVITGQPAAAQRGAVIGAQGFCLGCAGKGCTLLTDHHAVNRVISAEGEHATMDKASVVEAVINDIKANTSVQDDPIDTR